MFPKKDLSNACATTISLADYTSWVDETRQNYETRQSNVGNLNTTATPNSAGKRRRKRSTFVKSNKFCATLLQDNGRTYGINPKQQGNSLAAAIICDCSPPWKRVRKQIKYKYCYSDKIIHPKNDEFKKLKLEVENHVCHLNEILKCVIDNISLKIYLLFINTKLQEHNYFRLTLFYQKMRLF